MRKLKILVTGAGSPGGPGILKCLTRAADRWDILAGDANPKATGRYLSSEFVQLPIASDQNFDDCLMAACRTNGVDIVVPLVTAELLKLSKHKARFSREGIRVIVSDLEGLNIAIDKIALYRALKAADIPVPEFKVASDARQLEVAAYSLGYPRRAVVMKPGLSNGSRGVRVLDQNRDAFQLLFCEKPTHIYTTLEDVLRVVGSRSIPTLLLSEFLPGEEVTVDSIISRGEIKFIVARVRERMNGGISVAGRFEVNNKIFDISARIASLLSLDGPIGFQFRRSVHGEFQIIEINPRLQGTTVAATGLGINLPQLVIDYCLNPALPPFQGRRDGIGFARYYEEVFYPT